MGFHQLVSDVMEKHKSKIELVQCATMASFSTLVFNDYIKHFKQAESPYKYIQVPAISIIHNALSIHSQFMKQIASSFVEILMKDQRFNQYITLLPELELFHGDNIESFQTIFDIYILPNVHRHLPAVIAKKFRLGEDGQYTFIEHPDVTAMEFSQNDDCQSIIEYLVAQFVIQLLSMCPTLDNHIVPIAADNINNFKLSTNDRIVIIGDNTALCPLYITNDILDADVQIKETIEFVTSCKFTNDDDSYRLNIDSLTGSAFSELILESPEHFIYRTTS